MEAKVEKNNSGKVGVGNSPEVSDSAFFPFFILVSVLS